MSEIVVETSQALKDVLLVKTTHACALVRARARAAKSAASENICTCTCRTCNMMSAEKPTFEREKCLAML